MCVTIGPAKLTGTLIMTIPFSEDYHLTAYSNKAQNLMTKTNALILPVPGFITKEDFFDTTAYAGFMKEIQEAQTPKSRGVIAKSFGLGVENFQLGMYNVFLSDNLADTNKVMSELPEDKRYTISDELIEFYSTHYEGWPIVVACFESNKMVESQPIMYKYKPYDKSVLFYPGMDAHTGHAPVLTERVDVDHFLIGDVKLFKPFAFEKNNVPDFLKNRNLLGQVWLGSHKNGDWYHNASDPSVNFIRHTENLIKKPTSTEEIKQEVE